MRNTRSCVSERRGIFTFALMRCDVTRINKGLSRCACAQQRERKKTFERAQSETFRSEERERPEKGRERERAREKMRMSAANPNFYADNSKTIDGRRRSFFLVRSLFHEINLGRPTTKLSFIFLMRRLRPILLPHPLGLLGRVVNVNVPLFM